jgi:hypothetical protein
MPTPRRMSLLGRDRKTADGGVSGSADALPTPRRMSLMAGGCIGGFHEEALDRPPAREVARVHSQTMLGRLLKFRKGHGAGPQPATIQRRIASASRLDSTSGADYTLRTLQDGTPRSQSGEVATATSAASPQVGLQLHPPPPLLFLTHTHKCGVSQENCQHQQ